MGPGGGERSGGARGGPHRGRGEPASRRRHEVPDIYRSREQESHPALAERGQALLAGKRRGSLVRRGVRRARRGRRARRRRGDHGRGNAAAAEAEGLCAQVQRPEDAHAAGGAGPEHQAESLLPQILPRAGGLGLVEAAGGLHLRAQRAFPAVPDAGDRAVSGDAPRGGAGRPEHEGRRGAGCAGRQHQRQARPARCRDRQVQHRRLPRPQREQRDGRGRHSPPRLRRRHPVPHRQPDGASDLRHDLRVQAHAELPAPAPRAEAPEEGAAAGASAPRVAGGSGARAGRPRRVVPAQPGRPPGRARVGAPRPALRLGPALCPARARRPVRAQLPHARHPRGDGGAGHAQGRGRGQGRGRRAGLAREALAGVRRKDVWRPLLRAPLRCHAPCNTVGYLQEMPREHLAGQQRICLDEPAQEDTP
mmetsp:Transcript_51091/g.145908  ORF Transcript_51091/g.145908 Transcript_51091/m.145908 type:complete len:421 (+) Transcript_51091:636-1898(+)